MNLRAASVEDAELLAALHGTAFEAPWPPATIADMLAMPGAMGLIVEDEVIEAMILWQIAADEAEIITVAVDPRRRRTGLGRLLVQAAGDIAKSAGAVRMLLEVAVDNAPAIALYRRLGFEEIGLRQGYYRRGPQRVDARVMRRDLNSAAPSAYS